MRHHLPRHITPPPTVHRPFSPSGPGGVTSLGPNQTLRAIPPPQEYYCVRISLIGGDPNSNGGRDSQGYYRGYLEGMRYPPAAVISPATPVSVEVRVYYDSGSALFTDGTRLMSYQFQMTIGASTAADNGFMLLMPCYNVGVPAYGGFASSGLSLSTSTSNTAQFTGGSFISHVNVTLGALTTGTVTIVSPGTYRIHAELSTRSLSASAAAADTITLSAQLNGSGSLASDSAQLIVNATPTHIDLGTGNPDAYNYPVYWVHLGFVYAINGLVAGDVLRTVVTLGTVGNFGGDMFFFVERIGN